MFIPDSRVHKYILHGKKMYTLHVISLKFVGKSPQTLQGKRRNSYNQKYLQWPQLFFFGRFNEEKIHSHWQRRRQIVVVYWLK